MRTSSLFTAASLAFAALAAPVNERRQAGEIRIVYGTATTIVDYVVWTTTTVTEDPAPATSTPAPVAAFYEAPTTKVASSSVVSTPLAVVPAAALLPVSSAPIVVPTTTSTPAPVVVAPTSTAQAASSPVVAAVVAPVQAVVSPVVAAAPAISTTLSTAVASATPKAATASASSGAYPYTGEMTYYDVSVGLGSCGVAGSNSQNLVAIPAGIMANGINPNANPKCGKQIEISYNGATHMATVFDTCPSCTGGNIDLPQPLFQAIAPAGDGRVSGVSWRFVN